ncbi:non-ribosomal peptide synthase/polyketide synthase, partial [Nocardia sp. KC 131]|uniref:non-ribosomal peptide synthase/polyketide synthase n=1 Tax=Nocardia arseniciresistens TaxID=3392119 RepID=UPI00398F629F
LVAGEAFTSDTVAAFGRVSSAELFNLYGPTEFTVHATHAPAAGAVGAVPIGKPVWNAQAYVLDARFNPVPVGVAGELYLAGDQLARGYLGRADLTADRFVAAPFGDDGARMYRTGDLVRRGPDGSITYLGRTDFQVKLRGMRIELGEIESALTAHESVAQAVVVVSSKASTDQIVGYVVPVTQEAGSPAPVDAAVLRAYLAGRLQSHMVPSAIMVLAELPLNANGKLDRRALPEPVFTTEVAFRAPRNPIEHLVAEMFAEVLGVERVGVDDSFFALGGDSIVSIQLVSRAKARGVVFSARDVFEQRTVAGLAVVAETAAAQSDSLPVLPELPGGGVGARPLTPVERFMVQRPGSFHRFHQAVTLGLPVGIDRAGIAATVAAVIDRHDMLRSRLRRPADAEWSVETAAPGTVDVDALIDHIGFDADASDAELAEIASAALDAALERLDPEAGEVIRVVWLESASPSDSMSGGDRETGGPVTTAGVADRAGYVIVVAHHLVVDGVSWRILVPDFVTAWGQLTAGQSPQLEAPVTSVRTWAHALERAAADRTGELDFWRGVVDGPDPLLSARAFDPAVDVTNVVDTIRAEVSAEVTQSLLTTVPALFHGGVNDGLLTALALAIAAWRAQLGVREDSALIRLEGHGREEAVVPGADLSRTVGWFTAIFPVRFDLAGIDIDAALAGGAEMGRAIKTVKEQLLAVPDRGVGYGLLRYLNRDTAGSLPDRMPGQISFNYLGRFADSAAPEALRGFGWLPAPELAGLVGAADADMPAMAPLDINAGVADDRLGARIAYPATLLDADRVREFAGLWVRALEAVARHADTVDAGGYTPSDFPLVRSTQTDIDGWERRFPALTDVWSLSPLQAGLLFHAQLAASSVDVYTSQAVLTLTGRVSAVRLRSAAQALVDRYENLRTAFVTDAHGNPVQLVLDGVEVAWAERDRRSTGDASDLIEADRMQRFDLTAPPLIRFTLIQIGEQEWSLVVTNHHILLDGWSMPLLMRDLLVLYATNADSAGLPPVRSYRYFLDWAAQQDNSASKAAWTRALQGVSEPTLLARPQTGREITTLSGEYRFELEETATAGIVALAAELGVTVNTVLQAAWGLVLGRSTGQDDVLFGTTVSGRPAELNGVENMVGLFINTVPVRVAFDPAESPRALLTRIQGEQADLLDHHHIGLADIQSAAGLGGLFDTLMVFESYPVDAEGLRAQAADIDGMAVAGLDVADATHYPLTLMAQLDSRLRIRASYLSDLFDADSVTRIADRLVRVLTALVAAPAAPVGDIDLLGETERSNVLERWVSSGNDGGPGLFAEATTDLSTLVDAAVAAHGDRVAVRFGDDELTYAELDQRANQLARNLIGNGAGPGQLVAVILPRSLDLVVALLAVIKTGAGYVPIDPAYPADRIAYVLSDAAPASVIVDGSVDVELLDGVTVVSMAGFGVGSGDLVDTGAGPITDGDRIAPLRASNTAYVIYTSGSTGRPKGVVVPHRNVVRLFANTDREFGFGPQDVWTLFHSSAFDFSVWELWGALLYGGTVVVVDYFVSRSPEQFLELLRRERVTVLNQTPSAFYQLAEVDRNAGVSAPLALRYVVFGGEALDLGRLSDWMARHGDGSAGSAGPRLVNMYGITETTVHVTHRVLDIETVAAATGSVIGRAIAALSVYVLDTRLNPVPVGVPGEMYVAGPQLADGYLGRADLTTARFVANPYGGPGSRLYRSGDLARWNEQGELEHLGRADDQVKLRGFRIELGEIEAALLALDEVAQAAVVVRSDNRVSDQLVGYLVPVDGEVDTEQLRARLSDTLPPYMVPSVLMALAALPLTVNGKLDRKALPAPVVEAATFRAPVTAAEEIVAGVFAEVLGVDRVGLDDDFFALGGNSLIATRLAARLAAALDTQVGVREIFEASTVAALAARAGSGIGSGARQALVPQQRPELVPLSLAQQRMWFLNRFDPESAVDNIPVAVRLSGLLDRQALQIAVADVLARHESLRTRYPEVDGTAHQEIVPTGKVIPDLSPVDVTESELPQRLSELVLRGFDVTSEVPLRGLLFEISPTEHVLALVVHHIGADGFSMGPLTRDVMTAYAARVGGGEPAWAPLAVQYADFALWQRSVLGSEDDPKSAIAEQISFWRKTLAGLPEQLDLPSDRPRPAIASGRGARLRFEIDSDTHAGLTELAHAQGTTLFMVVHAALAALLARLSGESDIAIGTPIAGRGERALDDLVGMFVNTLVLRTEVDGGVTFRELLRAVRATDIAAFGHADLPFERLVEILNPARSQARNPLFQVMLAWQNTGQTMLELPELTVSAVDLPSDTAKFDLQLVLAEQPGGAAGGISAEFIYATDLFDAATVADVARRFTRIMKAIAATPDRPVGDLPLLDVTERAVLLQDWNDTRYPIEVSAGDAAGTLISLFEAQVAATPNATAVTFEGTSLSYAELAERVRQLARWLVEHGVGAESLIALGMRRSIDLVVGMYAALAAGGGYLPLDPDHPAERTAYLLATADPACVLTSGDDLPIDTAQVRIDLLDLSGYSAAPVTDADRIVPVRPSNTAYVIFTSGSTGRPKGVAVSHAAIVNRLVWMQAAYGLTAADVVLQKTPATFDVSVWEFFWPLQIGARLVVARPDGHRDPAYLAEVIDSEQVTTAHFVPAMMSVFVAEPAAAQCTSLRQVFASGEALPAATAQRLRELTGARLHNLYGPTEAAVDVTYHEVIDADTVSVPIGAPVSNTQVYVLDARLHPVPVGVAGELYLAGAQLARGYVERPDLSADRFVANPFTPGERMYRTGDLVRWVPASTGTGELEYLGRTDFQVKLRGLRIELGEIEAALTALEPIAQSVVIVRSDDRFGDQLVGYLIAAAGRGIDIDSVRAELARSLPTYMVPSAFVILNAFPLNMSGKVDRKALPAPVLEARVLRRPVTPIEEIVADTFADVLGIRGDGPEVGLDDDFFELGGNSLIATQVTARLGAALDTRIPVRTLFDAPTVGALAARLSTHVGAGGRRALVAGPRPEQIPLSLAQQRMWFLNRFDMASAVNNLPLAIRLTGDLDVVALQQAVRDVVARHEALRTYYPETADGQGVQVILPAGAAAPALEPIAVTAADLNARIADVVLTGFDVTGGVPVRAELLRLESNEHVLVVVVHHISGDGWSMRPLARDVMAAYVARSRGEVPGWAPLPVQYADYALWQRETLGAEDDPESLIAKQTAYWTATLAGLPGRIDLPMDRPRPVAASNRGGVYPFSVDAALQQQLSELARAHGASSFMVVHAALVVLVGRLSGSADIAIGTPVAGRGEAELDDLIGMFVNTLVLRTPLDPNAPFTTLLAQTKDTDLGAFAHADVPFERLVDVLSPERSQAHHPLFQVALSFEATGVGGATRVTLPGLELAAVDFDPGTAKFDLQLAVADPVDGGLALSWNYATDLFDAETVAALAERLMQILRRVAADPDVVVGDIDLLGEVERVDVTQRWVSSGSDGGVGLFADAATDLSTLVDAVVAAHGDRVAVRFGDDELTYAELDQRANRLARNLIADGAGPGQLVAVILPRSLDLVVALLAVIKTGAGYVPIDPSYPADRIAYVLSDAAPAGVIVDGSVNVELPDDVTVVSMDGFGSGSGDLVDAGPVTDSDRIAPLRASNTAYVIYTSGSTGRPKGVVVAHRNVVRLFANTDREFGFGPQDVWTLFHSSAFDFSVWELWGALLYGGTSVVVDYFVSRSPEEFLELLRRERVTVLNQTPSAFYQLAEADRNAGVSAPLALRYVVFGGEALDLGRLSDWMARHGDGSAGSAGPRLVNMYGITETTVHVTHRVLDVETVAAATGSVIGRAIAGLSVYVLDTRLNPVPVGVPGEMYVAGPQLADGYLGRADLTTARFVANPFGGAGERLYRSGDLARWNDQGELEHLGRADDQVKVRGFRIELGEIEAALLALDEVAQAAVVVRSDDRVSDQLVGYVVPVDGEVDTEQLRARLSDTLPPYMVPSVLMVLAALPLTVNGKLDRRALPAPVVEAAAFRAPVTAAEEAVAGVFAEVLGVDRVGLDDDFFALGGNSLIATRVAARLAAALDTQVGVRELFEASTVATLAARLEQSGGAGRARPPLVAGKRPERIPLSSAQRRYWFLNQFDTTTSAVDNIPLAVRLSGALDVAALERALGDLVARHEVLHTIYPQTAEGPHQVILPVGATAWRLAPVEVTEAELVGKVIEFALTTFDVTVEVPLAVALFRIAPEEHVLAFTVHHVSADGFSLAPLARDVMTAYVARVQGDVPQWLPLSVQYADYALWQHAVLGSEEDPESLAAQQVAYWQSVLAELPDQLELPADRPRPPAQSFHGKAIRFEISPERHARLLELARANNASLFMVVHAALAVLLSRLSGTDDIAVGTPIAGRGERELDDMIGMFVNTLVFRTKVAPGDRFSDLLADVKERDLEAFANADVPFERLVEVLNPVRSTAHNPLFQVGFSFQNLADTTFELPGLSVSAVNFDSQLAKTDLHVTLFDRHAEDGTAAEIGAEIGYAVDLFDEATVQSFADRFVRVLDAVMADGSVRVGEIDLLDVAESNQILHGWNDTAREVDRSATLVSLLDATVAAGPDAVAIVADEAGTGAARQILTYADLDVRVNRLSRYLIARGIGAEDQVALAIHRSVDLVVAMYAVARTGAAYVPLDPSQPADRLDYVLATAAPSCVLTTTAVLESRAADQQSQSAALDWVALDDLDLSGHPGHALAPAELVREFGAANTAYVIFTSGSTGRPKGVAVPHGAVANQLMWKTAEFGLGSDDAVLLKTAATFDLSVWEFWTAAVSGGRLVIAAPDGHRDPTYLNELMRATEVTTLHVVPSMLDALLTESDGTLSHSLRQVLAIGEALPAAVAQRFRRGNAASLYNLYGPTETAVSITSHRVTDADQVSVSIGAPEWNSRVSVLDARLRPVPVGVSGELYLSGTQLARGYFGRVDLTADRFVADPFGTGERMYRTGDLVAWNGSGELEYRGRTDFQVKIRGFRIELGEIEAALLALPVIAQAAVVAKQDERAGDRLVAYLVPAAGALDLEQVKSALAKTLPSYMMPTAFVVLDALPQNANGKLDRRALPEPEFEVAIFRAPSTPVEEIVAAVVAEVLGIERVGADDDFFGLGGDSIRTIQLVSRAKERGVRFTPRDVFDRRSVSALAEIATLSEGTEQQRLVELPGGGVGEIPLSPIVAATLASDAPLRRFVRSVALRLPDDIDRETLVTMIGAVVDHHDALRSRLRHNHSADATQADSSESTRESTLGVAGWAFETREPGAIDVDALVHRVDVPGGIGAAGLSQLARAEYDAALGRLDPANAVMTQFMWFAFGGAQPDVLLVVGHRFVGDDASWRIVLADLAVAWSQRVAGRPVALPAVGTSMRRWAHALAEAAHDPARIAELPFWQQVSATHDPQLGTRAFDPAIDTVATVERVEVSAPAGVTEAVLTAIPELYRGGAADSLLSALALAVSRWRGEVAGGAALVRVVSTDRAANGVAGADLSRTVGWFASESPVRLDLAGADLTEAFAGETVLGGIVKSMKEQLLAVPGMGLGYGLLRYLNQDTADQLGGVGHEVPGQIRFCYAGHLPNGASLTGDFSDQPAEMGRVPVAELGLPDTDLDPSMSANATVDITASVVEGADGPRLRTSFAYPAGLLTRARVQELAELWVAALTALASHARQPDAGGRTPSDLPLVSVGQSDIEILEREYPVLAEVWPLSPLQSGLLVEATTSRSAIDGYTMQAVVDLDGTVDTARLRAAAQGILDRYPNLRAAFTTDSTGQSVQVIQAQVEVPWREVDLTTLPRELQHTELQRLVTVERETRFDMAAASLIRFTLYRTDAVVEDVAAEVATNGQVAPAQGTWQLAVTTHHILLDGWSLPLLMRDLLVLYAVRGDATALPAVGSYRDFLSWLAGRDKQASLQVWQQALAGVEEPTQLAPQQRTTDTGEVGKLLTEFDAEGTRRIAKHAAALGVTVNTLVQAAWGIVLGRMTGRADVVFGATVSGRPADLPSVESMVGLFINTLPVRVRVDDNGSVGEYLRGLQRDQAELLDHHYAGLNDIQRIAGAGAHFDTLLVFESYPVDKEAIAAANSIDGMSVTGVGVADTTTNYPLTLVVSAESTMELAWTYRDGWFTTEEVEVLAARMHRVLEALLGDPATPVADIDILDAAERAALLGESSSAAIESAATSAGHANISLDAGPRTVAEVLGAVAGADPFAVALLTGDAEVAFSELDSRSSQLARVLIGRSIGPGDTVAVALPHSVEQVLALWAVQKAGAAALLAGDLSSGEILSTGADIVITAQPADGSPRGLALAEPATRAEMAAAAAHPVSDDDRVRPLHEDHPAFVLPAVGPAAVSTRTVLTQTQALDRARTLCAENEIDYESVTYTTAASGTAAVAEFLTAATVGAMSVLPTGDSASDRADGEVTHWFVVAAEMNEEETIDDGLRIIAE